MKRFRIHVPLLETPSALREADAVPVGEGRFRLVGRPRQGDQWRFKPGEIVECASRTLEDGSKVLVAESSASADPEYRKRRAVYAIVGAIFGLGTGALHALAVYPSIASVIVGALIGGCVFALLSVRLRDAWWRAWSWWDSLGWWPRGW